MSNLCPSMPAEQRIGISSFFYDATIDQLTRIVTEMAMTLLT